ncbi:MAG TPA: divergent polysaccharide deacetylase family protein [Woeseiaceae bacterium]|nr:divergent polysaccharide deacetylase family protein [Woeseiaceae bacterium]
MLALCTAAGAAPPAIAIIIDDLGYELSAGQRVVALPGPVACAVLPSTPRAALLAEAAFDAGKDVLLHLPLQPVEWDGATQPGAILLDTTHRQLSRSFEESLRSVPHVVGVNTHQGSLLTRHPGHMHWLMEEIRARGGLFFVDSYTTHESIALRLAREAGVPAVKRDVFLDPDRQAATVEREFARLKRLARERGMAVGIGHPYPATLALLERELPKLAGEGFRLVSISEYVSQARGVSAEAGPPASRRVPGTAAGVE